MKNYDEIIGFDYTNENEWVDWIREKFLPLHKQLCIVLRLREHLEDVFRTNFKEIFKQKPIKEVLLGGVTKEGEYVTNSLAKLYKDALGISINTKKWVVYSQIPYIEHPEDYLECNFESTPFLLFINKIKKLTEKILSKIGEEPKEIKDEEVKEVINSPEKLLDVIRELYEYMVSISANYDYHMFFVLNTRCIPRFYIEKAYPKLKENYEKVAKILGLEEKFIPKIDKEKIRKDYTLIGHKKDGLADVLFDIQHLLWNCFNFSKGGFWDEEKWIDLKEIKEVFSKVELPKELWQEFKEKIEKVLVPLKKLEFNTVEINITGYNEMLYFVVKNAFVIKVFNRYSPRTTYAFYEKDVIISLTELLGKVSPYIFSGVILAELVDEIPYPEVLNGIENIDGILKLNNLLEV